MDDCSWLYPWMASFMVAGPSGFMQIRHVKMTRGTEAVCSIMKNESWLDDSVKHWWTHPCSLSFPCLYIVCMLCTLFLHLCRTSDARTRLMVKIRGTGPTGLQITQGFLQLSILHLPLCRGVSSVLVLLCLLLLWVCYIYFTHYLVDFSFRVRHRAIEHQPIFRTQPWCYGNGHVLNENPNSKLFVNSFSVI